MTTITLPRATVEQALEALEYAQQDRECPSTTRQAITDLRAALAQSGAHQVSPADFVEIVEGREEIVGVPVYWAQWPTEVTR